MAIKTYYWDTSVFLAYINSEPGRLEVIESLWTEITEQEARIVTASIATVEVARANIEKPGFALDLAAEERIDQMWSDPTVLQVESPQQVMFEARKLIRAGLPQGWVLTTFDAIHLATAMWINHQACPITEFHTYDRGLEKYQTIIGVHICEPRVQQPRLL